MLVGKEKPGATTVTMGLPALPMMPRGDYSPELASGAIAASRTLGQIIPQPAG